MFVVLLECELLVCNETYEVLCAYQWSHGIRMPRRVTDGHCHADVCQPLAEYERQRPPERRKSRPRRLQQFPIPSPTSKSKSRRPTPRSTLRKNSPVYNERHYAAFIRRSTSRQTNFSLFVTENKTRRKTPTVWCKPTPHYRFAPRCTTTASIDASFGTSISMTPRAYPLSTVAFGRKSDTFRRITRLLLE